MVGTLKNDALIYHMFCETHWNLIDKLLQIIGTSCKINKKLHLSVQNKCCRKCAPLVLTLKEAKQSTGTLRRRIVLFRMILESNIEKLIVEVLVFLEFLCYCLVFVLQALLVLLILLLYPKNRRCKWPSRKNSLHIFLLEGSHFSFFVHKLGSKYFQLVYHFGALVVQRKEDQFKLHGLDKIVTIHAKNVFVLLK